MSTMTKRVLVALTAVTVAAGLVATAGCSSGGRKGPYAKHISIRPLDQYQAMFMRLERSFRRRDLDATMDCYDRDQYLRYRHVLNFVTDLYRRGDQMTLSLYRAGVLDKPTTRTFELHWKRAFFDIYDRCWHKARGKAQVTVSKGEVPKILEVRGDDPFAP